MIVLQAAVVPAWDRTLFLWLNLDAQSAGALVGLALFATHWLPLLALIAVLAMAFGPPRWRRTVWTMAAAMALAWWCASLLKRGITAPRPFMLGLGTDWLGHARGNGFPSSHASVAAACAVVAWRSEWPRALRCCLVLACALIGWSRVALGVHFPSDVAVAVLLGSLCALLAQVAAARLIPRRGHAGRHSVARPGAAP